jgi:hypothetical protein
MVFEVEADDQLIIKTPEGGRCGGPSVRMIRRENKIWFFLTGHLLSESTFNSFLLYDGLHFLLCENSVLSFKHVDDTILANIKGFSVVIHLAGYFPAV